MDVFQARAPRGKNGSVRCARNNFTRSNGSQNVPLEVLYRSPGGPDLHQVGITGSTVPIKQAASCQEHRNAAPARGGKNGAAGISGQMLFPAELRRLFQRHVHAPMGPYVDPPPPPAPPRHIHTRHVSIWTLMSAGSVLGNRIQAQQLLPAANLRLSACSSRGGGLGGLGGGGHDADCPPYYVTYHV